ncbi:MAG: Type 1 glutamine amidotransferase-like domain-containing protein [Actinomycetota bacterium]|nr:Type 1 glutamine amidotransferase-like domain-containing protein [Actinomycetota bacterium]
MDDPLVHARIGLVGSGEFTPAMEDIDREILSSLPRDPHVVILPTAAAGEDPHDWATRGVEHFQRLGARASGLMVLNWAHADDPEFAAALESADLCYISGGKPARLLSALEGSALFRSMLILRRNGGWIVGSSAGAMVLGDWTLVHAPGSGHGTPTMWTIGLGILQGMAVVPHYDLWEEADGLAEEIESSCTVFGIAEDTAVLLDEGHGRVLGATRSCIRAAAVTRWIDPGGRFELAL